MMSTNTDEGKVDAFGGRAAATSCAATYVDMDMTTLTVAVPSRRRKRRSRSKIRPPAGFDAADFEDAAFSAADFEALASAPSLVASSERFASSWWASMDTWVRQYGRSEG